MVFLAYWHFTWLPLGRSTIFSDTSEVHLKPLIENVIPVAGPAMLGATAPVKDQVMKSMTIDNRAGKIGENNWVEIRVSSS